MIPRIKICCIANEEEAQLAIKLGAAAIGLVGKMPSGPGPIEDELIHKIARSVPPPIATFLLTSETTADAIIRHHYKTGTNTLQLVDALTNREYEKIKTALPAVKIVQVIHVVNEASVEEAIQISESVDALLLDSGNASLAIKELGGTGRVHDWTLSKKIVEASKVQVFLAGGLHAGNVKEAIQKVQPFGIDVCSGVRTNGKLDSTKLEAFIKAIIL
jgi:phosphoribosylanthranilate isomerase